MARLRRFAMAALAAVTVAVGSLASATPASAAMSCQTALALHDIYMATGYIILGTNSSPTASATASYWFGKASGILQGACS
jgi:hypothetical protein